MIILKPHTFSRLQFNIDTTQPSNLNTPFYSWWDLPPLLDKLPHTQWRCYLSLLRRFEYLDIIIYHRAAGGRVRAGVSGPQHPQLSYRQGDWEHLMMYCRQCRVRFGDNHSHLALPAPAQARLMHAAFGQGNKPPTSCGGRAESYVNFGSGCLSCNHGNQANLVVVGGVFFLSNALVSLSVKKKRFYAEMRTDKALV